MFRVTIVYPNGAIIITGSKHLYVYESKSDDVVYVVMNYWYRDKVLNVTYIVKPVHCSTIYLLTYPPYLGDVSVRVVRSYSWYSYPWRDAPWGLEMMMGTEGCYVEESMAGRIFILFYYYSYPKVKDVLDEIGIKESWAKYEIAATALWASQLVREAKESYVDPYLCVRSISAILRKYYGFSDWLSFVASIAILPLCKYVKHVDEKTLYKVVLYAIKSVKKYVEVFPEWKRVDEEHWVEMCERLKVYTLKPVVPTYAHALLVGAYMLYEVHNLEVALEKAIIELIELVTDIEVS